MSLVVVTPPAALVTPAQARAWAPVLAGEADDRLEALLGTAQAGIEPPDGWVGRAFGVQVLEARLSGFPAYELALPCPPLRAVASVTFRDEAGADQLLPDSAYEVLGLGTLRGLILPRAGLSWPRAACRPESVRIHFEAGYAPDDPQLMPVRQAIVLAATHLRSLATQDLALRGRTIEGAGSFTWTVSDAAEKLIRNAVEHLLMPLRIYA